jgi:hypothetical protein
MDDLRAACARIAAVATHVTVDEAAIPAYAAGVRRPTVAPPRSDVTSSEQRAALVLTLDAINFGSGWFPTLRKRDGLSGAHTIAAAWRERPAPTAGELAEIDAATLAGRLGQDPGHELMGLYAASLRDLAAHVRDESAGSFAALATSTPSAVALAERLGGWGCFADSSHYGEIDVPFRKRAQIAAADLQRAGAGHFTDIGRLTMFADNLVPHVLRVDGVLHFAPDLLARIDGEELIDHGSAEEVEIRACAVHAVELIVAAREDPLYACEVDEVLWNRGQLPHYKALPRHRSRCTAY